MPPLWCHAGSCTTAVRFKYRRQTETQTLQPLLMRLEILDASSALPDFPALAAPSCRRRTLCLTRGFSGLEERLEGANHQWWQVPPSELLIDLVADGRRDRVTGTAEAP